MCVDKVGEKPAEARKDLDEARATVPGREAAVRSLQATLAAQNRAHALLKARPAEGAPVAHDAAPAEVTHDKANAYEQIAEAARSGKININTGWKDLDKKILHKLENLELAVYKLQNGAYKPAFPLARISLPSA